MMEYIVIYENQHDFKEGVIGLLVMIIIFFASRWAYFKFKSSNNKLATFRKVNIFKTSLFFLASTVFIAAFSVGLIGSVIDSRKIKIAVKTNQYLTVEGKVEHYLLEEEPGKFFEKFSINDIEFQLENYVPYSLEYKQNRSVNPIIDSTRLFKVSYLIEDGVIRILKIEHRNSFQ